MNLSKKKKRRIICDDKLKELFDVDTFRGFLVSKLLTAHFVKARTMRVCHASVYRRDPLRRPIFGQS